MNKLYEAINLLENAGYTIIDNNDYDYNFNTRKNRLSNFIIDEAQADIAYNQQMSKLIVQKVKENLDDIYYASSTGTRTMDTIRIYRKGKCGQWQFEIKIDKTDGRFKVTDNSNMKVIIIKKDGIPTGKKRITNTETYYVTKNINAKGVAELIDWLRNNYDKYKQINAAAQDSAIGLNRSAISTRDPLKLRRGQPKRTTETNRTIGSTSVINLLKQGYSAAEIVDMLSK